MEDVILKVEGVGKDYILGTVTGETLKEAVRKRKSEGTPLHNEKFTALDDISFEVSKGETLGIIGSNGAGKSTLLKLISKITGPTRGNIYINGKVASLLEVGTGFHPELTGRENIYLNGAILGMSKKEIDSKIASIIEFSECEKFIDTPVKRYSSGMYVKLAFSVSAHLDADILIMDEVLAVGDVKFQHKCLEKMREIAAQEQRTILYVSHNMESVKRLCNRCIILDHGHLVYNGDTGEAVRRYFGTETIETDSAGDYRNTLRPGWLGREDVRLLSAEYSGKISCVKTYDPIKLVLKWKINKPVEKIGIRVEIHDSEDRVFASAVFYDQIGGEPGKTGESILNIDLSHINNGQYKTIYTVFSVNRLGESVNIDWVKGLDLVIDRENEPGKLKWDNTSWGNMSL